MSSNKVAWSALVVVILLSLVGNLYLLRRLQTVEQRLDEAITRADEASRQAANAQRQVDATLNSAGLAVGFLEEQLGLIETQVLTFTVPIDEEIEVETTIPFNERFEVPISVNVPINTQVNVPLQLGILGTYDIDVPIRTEVPVNTSVEVPIRKEVEISTSVPIRLDVPVSLSLADTELGAQLARWRTLLRDLQSQLPE